MILPNEPLCYIIFFDSTEVDDMTTEEILNAPEQWWIDNADEVLTFQELVDGLNNETISNLNIFKIWQD